MRAGHDRLRAAAGVAAEDRAVELPRHGLARSGDDAVAVHVTVEDDASGVGDGDGVERGGPG